MFQFFRKHLRKCQSHSIFGKFWSPPIQSQRCSPILPGNSAKELLPELSEYWVRGRTLGINKSTFFRNAQAQERTWKETTSKIWQTFWNIGQDQPNNQLLQMPASYRMHPVLNISYLDVMAWTSLTISELYVVHSQQQDPSWALLPSTPLTTHCRFIY